MDEAERIARLTEVNLDDLVEALGLQGVAVAAPLLRRLGRPAARRFARTILAADRIVGERGLAAGAEWGLGAFHTALRVVGQEHVPCEGPVLIAANHPGMTDTLALFAGTPRRDLRTIAARRPFLALLPNLSAPLIWVDEEGHSNRAAVREAVRHLCCGGAVLTFPGAAIEPDPAVAPGLAAALAQWAPSLDLFARLVPELKIVPALVSGVLSSRATHSPLRLLRRTREGRSLLAAMIQLGVPGHREAAATLRFAPPLPVAALARGRHPTPATAAVVAILQQLLTP